jgi:uncharacterized membrane protein
MDAARLEATVNRGVAVILRHWIAAGALFAALVIAGAVAVPLLAAGGYATVADLGYSLYRFICPQRPDHSWFIAGHKMAFEQRDTAMFAAAALAGPLYLVVRRLGFKRLDGRVVLLLQIPILIDVFSQVVGLRDSDGFWRTVTGTLSVFAIAAWLFPRLDDDFRVAVQKIEGRLASEAPAVREQHLTTPPAISSQRPSAGD